MSILRVRTIVILLVALALAFTFVWYILRNEISEPDAPQLREREGESNAAALSSEPHVADLTIRSSAPQEEGKFAPDQVIGNPDCRFLAGYGNAMGVGMVVLPDQGGSRFEVLDGSGLVFGADLPFHPNHYRLAKHEDGSVLVGVGDLRLNAKTSRSEDAPEPVRIFRDGALIFETQNAWNFGLASSGSAFFVVEPTAGSTSQLLIHNLDMGATYQHDLGHEYSPSSNDLPYRAMFSKNDTEVMMVPSGFMGGDSHHFFPSDGGPRRTITLKGGGDVVFESSTYGYYAFGQGVNQPFLIKKKEFRWDTFGEGQSYCQIWCMAWC